MQENYGLFPFGRSHALLSMGDYHNLWPLFLQDYLQHGGSMSLVKPSHLRRSEVGKTSTSSSKYKEDYSLLMAEGMHIHQTPLKDNEDSLLKHGGIYKRIKSFPFFQPNFLFPVVCSFPILQTQDYSFFTEKKIKDIHMYGRLRFETINTHIFSKYI